MEANQALQRWCSTFDVITVGRCEHCTLTPHFASFAAQVPDRGFMCCRPRRARHRGRGGRAEEKRESFMVDAPREFAAPLTRSLTRSPRRPAAGACGPRRRADGDGGAARRARGEAGARGHHPGAAADGMVPATAAAMRRHRPPPPVTRSTQHTAHSARTQRTHTAPVIGAHQDDGVAVLGAYPSSVSACVRRVRWAPCY
eukprot:COSAG01_NODE_2484_length_7600_cov_2.596587_13_plen_200_part_00